MQSVARLLTLYSTPLTAFALIAVVYLLMGVLTGAYLAIGVQVIALAVLFLATPVVASICRSIASPSRRVRVAVIGGAICVLTWTALALSFFHWSDDRNDDPPVVSILRCAVPALLLYVPLTWLACGGTRTAMKRDRATLLESPLANTVFWLVVATLVAAVPELLMANLFEWWGPFSVFIGPVAGILW